MLAFFNVSLSTSCSDKPTTNQNGEGAILEEPESKPTAEGENGETGERGNSGESDPFSRDPSGKEVEQTRIVDSFLLPSRDNISEEFSVPTRPFHVAEFDQTLPAPKSADVSILDGAAPATSITINSPLQSIDTHQVTWKAKDVDVFVVIDDSESFAAQGDLRGRTQRALRQLARNLAGMNWRIFLSGLPGNTPDDSIMISSDTTTDVNAAVNTGVETILQVSTKGDAQVFRGLADLVYKFRTADRDNAVHAYFIISDKPNCKDEAGADSESCNVTPGNKDHHRYLFDKTSLLLPEYMQNMSLFGAYYRMNNTDGICTKLDKGEVPATGDTLKLNSQYADLAFFWERFLFPATPESSTPKWIGDVCAKKENTDFVNSFTSAIKNLAQNRFPLATSFEGFPSDAAYDFKVQKPDGTALTSTEYQTKSNQMVILSDSTQTDIQLTAIGNKNNDYRKTDFLDVLTAPARDGSVTLSWNYRGTPSSLICKKGGTFSGSLAAAHCRHWDKSVYLRNYDALPQLAPATPAETLALTVHYELDIAAITSVTVHAATNVILPEHIRVERASGPIPSYSVKATGQDIVVDFAEALLPGEYTVRYFDESQQKTSVTLPAQADAASAPPLCYAAEGEAQLSGDTIELKSGTSIPCLLRSDARTVDLDGLVPVDAGSGVRRLRVAFLASVASQAEFSLKSNPTLDSLKAVRFTPGDTVGAALLSSDIRVEGSILYLNNALQPGERMTVSYTHELALGDGCFVLSAIAKKATPYYVRYGPVGHEETLEKSLYSVTVIDDSRAKICLDSAILDFGQRLLVTYLFEGSTSANSD